MKDIKGIILAGGSGTRLHPCTKVMSKQLLPVYDKPMIYYPLSTLMDAGIKEILIISTPRDLPAFKDLLGDGKDLGITLEYAEQPYPDGLAQAFIIAEDFLNGSPSCLILGDNLFYGNTLMLGIENHIDYGQRHTAKIFTKRVIDPERYGVVVTNHLNDVIELIEKPTIPMSTEAITGIYLFDGRVCEFAKQLKPSSRGELEILDLLTLYLKEKSLVVQTLDDSTTWLDTGTHKSLARASTFVRLLQETNSVSIGCIEEIAYKQDFISYHQFRLLATRYANSDYGDYLKTIK